MKYTIKHYEFIDKKLLPMFGIKSICDYQTTISYDDLSKNADFLDNINELIPELKKLFTVREFSLHKYDNRIKTIQQAIGIIKKCLRLLNINFTIETKKNVKYMRLTERNILLNEYIKMTDFREDNINYEIFEDFVMTNTVKKNILLQQEVYKNVKKQTTKKFLIEISDTEEYLCIDLKLLYTNSCVSCIMFNLLVDPNYLNYPNYPNYDEYIVQNTTFDTVDIIIDEKQLYQTKYLNGINIMPQGLLMLPIAMTPFSSYVIKLKYARDYKPIIGNMSKCVSLEMILTELIFKKQFKYDNYQQNINFDFDQIIFYTEQGLCHCCTKQIVDNLSIDDIEYEPYVYENYNGAFVKKNKKNESLNGCECLMVLVSDNKYEFTAELFGNTLSQFSREIDDEYETYKCVILRNSDVILMDHIIIQMNVDKPIINIIDIFIISYRNNDCFKIDTDFDVHNNNGKFNVIFKEPLKINLVGALSGCFLYVQTKNSTKINSFRILGTALFFETNIRRKYGSTINNTIEDENS